MIHSFGDTMNETNGDIMTEFRVDIMAEPYAEPYTGIWPSIMPT